MKKLVKIISLLLATILLLGMFACGEDKNEKVAKNTSSDYTSHFIDGTLHKVNVTETNRPFIQNKYTEYKIVAKVEKNVQVAANFIVGKLFKATGCQLVIENQGVIEYTPDVKVIYIDCLNEFTTAGLEMPEDDIGDTGYYIKNVGNTVFIMANHSDGYQQGCIAFLREVVGYDMISENVVVFEKSGETLPDMDIIERPDIDYGEKSNFLTSSELYGMGFLTHDIFIRVTDDSGVRTASEYHDSLNILPPELYEEDHPGWYAMCGGTKQLCFTAHGDYSEYQLMLDTAYEKIMRCIDEYPSINILNFGQSDGRLLCDCEYCKKCSTEFGAISSTVLMFVNELNDKVQQELQRRATEAGTEKREFKFTFFAYHGSQMPPVIYNADGTYSIYTNVNWNIRFSNAPETKIKDLKCADEVGVLVAPIEAIHPQPIYDRSVNEMSYNVVKGWSTLTNYMCTWYYSAFYHDDWFYPSNTFSSMIENYRLSRECQTHYLFYQGVLTNVQNPGFTMLKRYIDAKAKFDVNLDLNELINKYFKYFYGEGGEYMREFYDELVQHMTYLQDSGAITGSSYDVMISLQKNWPLGKLLHWNELCNLALESVEGYKGVDDEKYNAYVRNITCESILPRWSLLRNYSGYFTKEELIQMKRSFVKDADALGLARQQESMALDLTEWRLV